MSDDRPAIFAAVPTPVLVVVQAVNATTWGAHRKGVDEIILRPTAAGALGALLRGRWYIFTEASAFDNPQWSAEEFGSRVMADPRMFGITAEIVGPDEKLAP